TVSYCNSCVIEIAVYCSKNSNINNIWVSILTKGNIKLSLRVYAKQAIKTRLVKINNSSGTLNRRSSTIVYGAIPVPYSVIMIGCIWVLFQRFNKLFNSIFDNLIAIN